MIDEIKELRNKANTLRKLIIEMAYQSEKIVHIGPSLSCVDIMAALYFKFMRVDPKNPKWEERDRFIMSKGHAYTVLYAVLSEKGFFLKEELKTLRQLGSILQGQSGDGQNFGGRCNQRISRKRPWNGPGYGILPQDERQRQSYICNAWRWRIERRFGLGSGPCKCPYGDLTT